MSTNTTSKTEQKVITLVTKAASSISKATTDLGKQMEALQSLVNTSVEITEEIEFKQSQLTQLEQQIADEARRKSAELELRVLEDEDAVLTQLLDARKSVDVPVKDLNELKTNLATALQINEAELNEAVAVAKRQGESALKAAVEKVKIEAELSQAENNAKISMLTTQLKDARDNVAELKDMLNAEREARVEIAQAGTNINLSTTGK